jgi:serine/threonine-protein kinase HipA
MTVGDTLQVYLGDVRVAELRRRRGGVVTLTYTPEAGTAALSVSLALPAVGREYVGERVANWLGGLLPDRPEVLERWRQSFGVDRADAFSLLWHVGGDVAGATRLLRPDVDPGEETGVLRELSDEEIGDRIRQLRQDAAAWGPAPGTGQFSLPGAQGKFALAFVEGAWAEPSGRMPTTHIFKPAIAGLADQDVNEHATMLLARACGQRVAPTSLRTFDGERVLVVERYDRYQAPDGRWHRLHQEDVTQALGLSPTSKYETRGGPPFRTMVELCRQVIAPRPALTDALDALVDALAFNWLVVGTDAHARNYSVMLNMSQVRLAPLYDLNSFLAYRRDRPSTLSMRIGFTEYDPDRVGRRDWDELARDCRLDPAAVLGRVSELAERLLGVTTTVMTQAEAAAPGSRLPAQLRALLLEHVRGCQRRLRP